MCFGPGRGLRGCFAAFARRFCAPVLVLFSIAGGLLWSRSFPYAMVRTPWIAAPGPFVMSLSSMTACIFMDSAVEVTQLSLAAPRSAGHALGQSSCAVSGCSSSALLVYPRVLRLVNGAGPSVAFVPPLFIASELLCIRPCGPRVPPCGWSTSCCMAAPRFACSYNSASANIGFCIHVGWDP